jgi:hypothetical protein
MSFHFFLWSAGSLVCGYGASLVARLDHRQSLGSCSIRSLNRSSTDSLAIRMAFRIAFGFELRGNQAKLLGAQERSPSEFRVVETLLDRPEGSSRENRADL